MEPDGASFAEPIVVRPASGNVLAFDLPSSSTKSKPEALPLNESGDGVLLSHFSTLVVVPPERSCGSVSGWTVGDTEAAKEHCADPAYPTYISFGCSAHEYCVAIEASCCAKPGATACRLGDQKLTVSFTPASYDPRYPYCGGEPADAGATDSGSDEPTDASAAGSGGGAGKAGGSAGGAGGQGGKPGTQPVCKPNDKQSCECGDLAGTRLCNSAGVYGECICRSPSAAGQGGSATPQAGTGGAQAGSGAGQGGSGGAPEHECDAAVQEDCECEPGVWGVRYCDEFHYTDCYCSDAGVGGDAGNGSAGSGGGASQGNAGSGAAGADGGGAGAAGGDAGVGAAGQGGGGGTTAATCNDFDDWESVGTVPNVEFFNGAWGDPASDDVWAVGKSTSEARGIIAHWNGSTWSTDVLSDVTELTAVTGTGTGTVIAVGSGGAIYKYTGSAWTSMYNPNTDDLYGVWAIDDLGEVKVWIVGASGAAHYWDGVGDWHYSSITSSASNSIGTLRGIWSAAGDPVWAVNSTGASSPDAYVVQRATYNAGQSQWTWTPFANNSYFSYAIWGFADNDIWAVGYDKGNAGHFDGTTWTLIPAPGSILWSVWGRTSDSVWAVGDAGQLDHWNGSAWTACSPVNSLSLKAVTGTSSAIWAFGSSGIALRNAGH